MRSHVVFDRRYILLAKSRLLFLFFLGQPHCLGFVVEGVDAVDTALIHSDSPLLSCLIFGIDIIHQIKIPVWMCQE